MPEFSKEIVSLLNFLLPGFLTAWVIYGLTNHEKPNQFERTIQALIFTAAIQAGVWLVKESLIFLGGLYTIATWGEYSEILTSYSIAMALGLLAAKSIQDDTIYSWLRIRGLTGKSSHPNEWNYLFSQPPCFVVLHLEGERRLFGWPEVWPSKPNEGHFFIVYPSWQTDDGVIELGAVEGILINAKDVKWVEFIKNKGEKIEQEQEQSAN
jgi:hypothetical protein